MDDYSTFDADAYLHSRYGDITAKDRVQFQLDNLHNVFNNLQTPDASLKVLDYGCGPVIQHSITAAAYASEIVLCDYAQPNRNAIRKWLRKDPAAFNWSPHFDYVVQVLEGKGEPEAREREEQLKKVVKDVVYCDVLSETPIEKGFEGPYDVVLEMGCLQTACGSVSIFRESIKRLAGLLKPGGTIVSRSPDISMDKESIKYYVGGREYSCLCITADFVASVISETGFNDVQVTTCQCDQSKRAPYNQKPGMNGYHFIHAKKLSMPT